MHREAGDRSRVAVHTRPCRATILSLLTTLAVGCAPPSVEEIRQKVVNRANGVVRALADAVDSKDNQATIQSQFDHVTNTLHLEQTALFASIFFKDWVETAIKSMEEVWPVVFAEQNVVAESKRSKTFALKPVAICAVLAKPGSARTNCERVLKAIGLFAVTVTLSGDNVILTLHQATVTADDAPLIRLEVEEKRISVAAMLDSLPAAAQAVAQLLAIDQRLMPKTKGEVKLEVSYDKEGVTVEATIPKDLEVQQQVDGVDTPMIVRIPATKPLLKVSASRGDLRVSSSLKLDASIPAGLLTAFNVRDTAPAIAVNVSHFLLVSEAKGAAPGRTNLSVEANAMAGNTTFARLRLNKEASPNGFTITGRPGGGWLYQLVSSARSRS